MNQAACRRGEWCARVAASLLFSNPIQSNPCFNAFPFHPRSSGITAFIHCIYLSPMPPTAPGAWGEGYVDFSCNNFSPVWAGCPHDASGLVLYEIPRTSCEVRENRLQLILHLKPETVKAMNNLAKEAPEMPNASKLPSHFKSTQLSFYGKGQFGFDRPGQANIKAYTDCLLEMYETQVGNSLLDEGGCVVINGMTEKKTWPAQVQVWRQRCLRRPCGRGV